MRKFMLVVIIMAALGLSAVTAYASPNEGVEVSEIEASVSDDERAAMADILASRGLSNADIQYEILYNHGSVAKFIMAIVSDGYLIADRDTWSVLEWSQNTNPYSDYADARSTMAA